MESTTNNSSSSDSDDELINIEDDEEPVVMKRSVDDTETAEYTETVENEGDDDLPPILAPPSTGYTHAIDENQPPPQLHPSMYINEEDNYIICDEHGNEYTEEEPDEEGELEEEEEEHEVVEIDDSGSENASSTDSDDDLVNVDYMQNPPETYQGCLEKYGFLASKENWVYNVRTFYKKQPTRVKRLLKVHKDAEGNPVEEPVEMLFEKIHAERETIKKTQSIKSEVEEEPKDDEVATTVSVEVDSSDPRLIHVAYPGNVVNNDKAIATLGGAGIISKTFEQPNKKLQLKFRPNDPFANGVNAQGRTACGLLLRVRRRKDKQSNGISPQAETNTEKKPTTHESPEQIPVPSDLVHDMLLDNQFHPQTNDQVDSVSIKEKVYRLQDVMRADRLATEETVKREKSVKAWTSGRCKDFNLKIPRIIETTSDSCSIETVGIVHRSYEFNGICDFQYLPVSKKSNGSHISVKDKIFPIFGTSENPEKLVMKGLINEEEQSCQTFSLPPAMSRIDNPPKGLIEELIMSEKSDNAARKVAPDDSVFSSRRKRIIYTISYNFQADGKTADSQVEVPSRPLDLAPEDIERRQIKKELVDIVRDKFEERPIWSKAALEFATKINAQTLKYIIPMYAYFATNGPWRNTWVKFGVDPRKNPSHVMYQAVDFRVPFIYRRFMNIPSSNPEANHKFLREHLPPKTQMFYQLCDIGLNEISDLTITLKKKAESGGLVFDEKFGFLKEGTYEYFRYILTYYLENLLQEHGRIPHSSSSEPSIKIPPGCIEPSRKLKAAPYRRVKVKRIRKSSKKVVDPSVTPKQNKSPKGKKRKAESSASRSYQQALEDLALNDLPTQIEDIEDVDYYEEDDDEEYLDD